MMGKKRKATKPGVVQKLIVSPIPGQPEKAEISIPSAEELYREIRIENTLTDEKGKEVRLKEGAEVDVTVEAEVNATEPKAIVKKEKP
jgi:uncharacterized protein YfaS (alpha-2-macroglobulin family)